MELSGDAGGKRATCYAAAGPCEWSESNYAHPAEIASRDIREQVSRPADSVA